MSKMEKFFENVMDSRAVLSDSNNPQSTNPSEVSLKISTRGRGLKRSANSNEHDREAKKDVAGKKYIA